LSSVALTIILSYNICIFSCADSPSYGRTVRTDLNCTYGNRFIITLDDLTFEPVCPRSLGVQTGSSQSSSSFMTVWWLWSSTMATHQKRFQWPMMWSKTVCLRQHSSVRCLLLSLPMPSRTVRMVSLWDAELMVGHSIPDAGNNIIIYRNYWLLILAVVVRQVFKGSVFSTLISSYFLGYLGAGCRQ